MKIVVTGTRGIPNIMGGIETHCEELLPRLVQLGYDITIITSSRFIAGIFPVSESEKPSGML